MVSDCEDIYLSGWGGDDAHYIPYNRKSTIGLTTTSGAFRTTSDGNDFYLMVLQKDAAALKYATFFGSTMVGGNPDHVDGGTSRFQKNGTIYQAVCAACDVANDFMTTPAAAFPTRSASDNGNCSMAAVKFSFPLVSSSFIPDTLQGCPGTATVFTSSDQTRL